VLGDLAPTEHAAQPSESPHRLPLTRAFAPIPVAMLRARVADPAVIRTM
jgi:hypothetical protein